MIRESVILILRNNMKPYISGDDAHSVLIRACWKWLNTFSPQDVETLIKEQRK